MPNEKDSSDINSNSDNGVVRLIVARFLGGKLGFWLAILFSILSILFVAQRAYKRYAEPTGQFDFAKSGMSDFHNGAYYPSKAFGEGINPYAQEVCETFPMARSAPPYSPVVFMLYLPFSWLSLPAADIAFFAFNVLLMGAMSGLCIGMIRKVIGSGRKAGLDHDGWLDLFGSDLTAAIWLFGWMMFSRPGHITLFTGYFTLQLVLGTILALHFSRTRPWLAAIGMLLASGKPTYIIPLAVLMFFRRDFRSLTLGLMLCAVFAAGGLGWLASHSDFGSVVEGVKQGQEAFDNDPSEYPVNTWTRLDAMGVVAKVMAWKPDGKLYLAGMLCMLVPVGTLVWRLANQAEKRIESEVESRSSSHTGFDHDVAQEFSGVSLSASICYLALLVSIYHHSYDGLIASVVWASVLLGGSATLPRVSLWERRVLLGLLTVPAVNYVATLRFRDLLGVDNQSPIWNVVTSLNGVCLFASLVLLLVCSVRKK